MTLNEFNEIQNDSNLCQYFESHGNIKCKNPNIKTFIYCPFIVDEIITCPIKEIILDVPCCPRCSYNMRSYLKDMENHKVVCRHCRSKFQEISIITYRELLKTKNFKRLRRIWFTF